MAEEPMYLTGVRMMPEEDRPRERLARLGPEALRDAELIAVLLRTGTREMGAVALADAVMKQFGDLRALSRASVEELRKIRGLGAVKAIEIKAALELGIRLASFSEKDRRKIATAQDIVDFLMPRYKHCETESFKSVLLNIKHEVLRVVEISSGGLNSTAALPADVFRQAVREGANAVIVCHNHPSGDPEPSRDDLALTKRLAEASQLIGVPLLDHVIFGDGRYVSFKERNLL